MNEFELTIEQPGIYGGQCAEFCGLAHGDMFFTVNALPADEYDAWVAEQAVTPGAQVRDVEPADEAAEEPVDEPTTDETSEETA